MPKKQKNKQGCFRRNNLLFLAVLIIIGLFYRFYGLDANHAFWTDEEQVAIFVRAIIERGRPVLVNGYSSGVYQWLQYWLSAISAKIFGLNEFGLRFPSVIFGILTIGAVYLVGKKLFNQKVGLVAAILTTFLKIEILWSRQARPYQALQFFYLLSAYFLYRLAKEERFNWHYFIGFLSVAVFASLFHGLGPVVFLMGFLYLFFYRPAWFKKQWLVLGFMVTLVFLYFLRAPIVSNLSQIGSVNNLFYYRVFLWYNYPLLVFLAVVGFLSQIFQKRKEWQVLFLFLFIQGVIVSFILRQPFVRYFYIVFPFLVLFSALGLIKISRIFPKKHRWLFLFIFLFFIVVLGSKFTWLPRSVYSLNEDMQEIPEVDYKQIYSFIEKKLTENPEAVYVSNWNDHPIWYLGEGELDYLLRKRTTTPFDRDPFSGAVYLKDVEEFRSLMADESQGLVLLESWDDQVPEEARKFIRQNLNKELEVDRLYPTQPRYWPVEIYSWGI